MCDCVCWFVSLLLPLLHTHQSQGEAGVVSMQGSERTRPGMQAPAPRPLPLTRRNMQLLDCGEAVQQARQQLWL